MKNIALTFVLLISLATAKAQTIKYDTIRVGTTTTIHLLFESTIQDYLLGSGKIEDENGEYTEVLLEQVGSNKLRVAAAVEDFSTTNLFVETESGYFNFILKYIEFPQRQMIKIADSAAAILKSKNEVIKKRSNNRETINELVTPESSPSPETLLEKAIRKKPVKTSDIALRSQGVEYFISGIYTNGKEIGFKLIVKNKSAISYELSYVNWIIKEKGNLKSKKGSIEVLEPISDKLMNKKNQNYQPLLKGSTGEYIYIYPKFTLPKTKVLVIEIGEKSGDRIVELTINNKQLLGAEYIKSE